MTRIEFIASLTKGYDTVLDIGSDHGLVLKTAFDNKYIKNGIATDINQGPLDHAKKTLTGYPVLVFLSDGFKSIDKDFDLAVITGMGARLIIDILKDAPKDKTFILGANDRLHLLRSWLADNGFIITDEYVIHDGFYYVFLKVKYGKMALSFDDLYLGPILKTKIDAKSYYRYQRDYYKDLTKKAKGSRLKEVIKIYTVFENYLK